MRVLVATDGSESANRAVDFASTLVTKLGGALQIVHVINTDTLPLNEFKEYALCEHASLGDVLTTFTEEKLAEARRLAESRGVKSVTVASPFGSVAEEVLEIARAYQAELVVVGRRGRGRLAGLLLGSASQKLASVASYPVVVVP